jgi:hypothetical protein
VPPKTTESVDAAAPPEGAEAAAPASPSHKATDRKAQEAEVTKYLIEHPDAKSPEINRGTGIPEGSIRKLDAWKAVRARRKVEKPASMTDAMRRALPLTQTLEAVVAAKSDDPAELAAAREGEALLARLQTDEEYRKDVEREYLETVDQSGRGRYHAAKHEPNKQILLLVAWKLTGEP